MRFDAVRELGRMLADSRSDDLGLTARQAAALRRRGLLGGDGLTRLFHDGSTVEPSAVAPLDPEALAAEGLVDVSDGRVRPLAQISPWLGLLVAHDPDRVEAPGADHVPGANTSGETLARATVRLPVASALDLGTGSGIHALLAAGHAERVVAVDVNPRAVRLAALNARLNGIGNVETREGSWLEPVAGERFDLVVCNPPYVLSPDRDYLFRDGGEGLAERLVRALPGHLSDGGFGHVLCNWATGAGESPWAPIEEWTRDSGCDALAVSFGSEGVLSYAARWADPGGTAGDDEYAARVERWLEHFRAAGVERIWLGVIVLRRRPGTTWFRGIGAPEPTEGRASDHLLRLFAAQDWLASSPGPILRQRLRLVSGHRLVSETSFGPKGYNPPRIGLSPGEGLGVRASVDTNVLRALMQLDGTRSLDEIVEEPLATPVAATAIHLLELGLLEPVP